MKKIHFLAMALAVGISASAQNDPQLRTPMEVKPRFGIKAGINSARLEIKDAGSANSGMNNNAKTSLHAGFFYNIPVAGAFRIQPEILYNIQGSKTSPMASADPNLAGLNEFDFHYVSVPLMLQLASPSGFMIEAGPQFSYLSSANADRNAGGEVNLKDRDYVKKTDFSLAGGVGYLSRIGLGVNARYVYGFTNVWNNEDSPSSANMDFRNRVLQVGLTYHFGAAK
ncbi:MULTISPECIES: porin family protein [Chitinophagaceae]|uniref:porin family protein n=1 Tax=Chitinophagaceae TaxID=563835 RepID=UPI000DEF2615|nr:MULTISPECIES: porin family protein [Chitinophagaceae]RPD46664.1 PorT family protein [Paracnuella aquatica]